MGYREVGPMGFCGSLVGEEGEETEIFKAFNLYWENGGLISQRMSQGTIGFSGRCVWF